MCHLQQARQVSDTRSWLMRDTGSPCTRLSRSTADRQSTACEIRGLPPGYNSSLQSCFPTCTQGVCCLARRPRAAKLDKVHLMKAKVLPLLSMSTAGETCVKTLPVSLLEAMSWDVSGKAQACAQSMPDLRLTSLLAGWLLECGKCKSCLVQPECLYDTLILDAG